MGCNSSKNYSKIYSEMDKISKNNSISSYGSYKPDSIDNYYFENLPVKIQQLNIKSKQTLR